MKLVYGLLCASFIMVAQDQDDGMVVKKSAEAEKMVADAVAYFSKPTISIGKACSEFANSKKWQKGELKIFIFGDGGECYVAEPAKTIWRDYFDEGNKFEESFIKDMLKIGERGGWLSYPWNNDMQYAYVRVVNKMGKRFIIGCGFYPESAQYRVRRLVDAAERYLRERGNKELFARVSDPNGPFVQGDVYLWVYDLEGNALAHGNNKALIGQNLFNWRDSDGKLRNQEMIKIAQSPAGSGWIDYKERGMLKRAYVKSVTDDRSHKTYIIGGGYYPELDDTRVVSFINRAATYLREQGKKIAFADFGNQAGDFVPGPLRLFVYDLDGTMLVDSQNPEFVGQNLMNAKDAEGKFITKRLIDHAKTNGKAWISFSDRNAYKDVYVEKISAPDGDFVIGAGYWPASKQRSVKSLVDKAYTTLENHPLEVAFKDFSSGDSDYTRGDLSVFVYDGDGICLVSGQDHYRIWQQASSIIPIKDTSGESVISTIISTAQAGGGWVEFKWNNGVRRVYVRMIEKSYQLTSKEQEAVGKTEIIKSKDLVIAQENTNLGVARYIVGSGYYL